MGLTQHRSGVLAIQMLSNLLLMRGNIGKPGAGIFPVRGHSNVQGQRTVGITEKPELVPLDRLAEQYGFNPPRERGLDTVGTCEAVRDRSVKAFISLGGNFIRAIPPRLTQRSSRTSTSASRMPVEDPILAVRGSSKPEWQEAEKSTVQAVELSRRDESDPGVRISKSVSLLIAALEPGGLSREHAIVAAYYPDQSLLDCTVPRSRQPGLCQLSAPQYSVAKKIAC
jgi:hypothetical protein